MLDENSFKKDYNEYNTIKANNFFENLKYIKKNKFKYQLLSILSLLLNLALIILIYNLNKKIKILRKELKEGKNNIENVNNNIENKYAHYYNFFILESTLPQLSEIYKKMSFEQKLPLPKSIHCKPHLTDIELMVLLSLLSNDTIFFETGSGCSSIIAKYFAKKTYAVEGCKQFYKYGIENGLKDNIIFKNLKPDDPTWSYPGKKSSLKDWKNYFQSYKKEYNADVILIDGRFKVATAMDIFNKIRNDTVILIHEYNARPSYYILEKYYKYIYHWGSLFVFVKRNEIEEIPLEIQKKYWSDFL
jgi:hypothetical protein